MPKPCPERAEEFNQCQMASEAPSGKSLLSANSPIMKLSVTAWSRSLPGPGQEEKSHINNVTVTPSPATHTRRHRLRGVNHRGKDHFTVLSAGSSIQKRSHWGTSPLPEAVQCRSCPAWCVSRGHEEWEVLERELRRGAVERGKSGAQGYSERGRKTAGTTRRKLKSALQVEG